MTDEELERRARPDVCWNKYVCETAKRMDRINDDVAFRRRPVDAEGKDAVAFMMSRITRGVCPACGRPSRTGN